MLTSFKRIALAASLCIAGSTAMAGMGTLYDCTLTSPGAQGWIAPRIIIGVEESETSAMVIDSIIQRLIDAPIIASVSPRDAKSIRVNWRLEEFPVGNINMQETVQYTAILFKDTGRIMVRGVLSYFDNEPRGSGTCTREAREISF